MTADQITKRCWEIAEELGMPVHENMKLYETLCDELREHCWPEYFTVVAILAVECRETRNPHFLDAAMVLCTSARIPITPTLQSEFAAAAKLRLSGPPAGTAAKVKKKQTRAAALMIMANLTHAGYSLKKASELAETAINGAYKDKSLAKYYNQEIKPEQEAKLHASWERTTPHHKKMWKSVARFIRSGKAASRAVSDS